MKINAAVIGMGVGEKHAKIYQENKFVRLKKIYEKDEKKVKFFKKFYPNVEFVKNENEIFFDKSIKIISLASFDNYHAKQILKGVKYKKHIFVEKPICQTLNELKKIYKSLAVQKKIKFSCNLVLRKTKQFIQINKISSKKKIGKIYYLEADYNYGRLWKLVRGWRGKIPFYSVMQGGGVHMIDLILNICKDLPVQVKAYGNKIVTKKTNFNFNDLSVAILKFKDGKILKVTSNFSCVAPHHHSIKIFGQKGTIFNDYYGATYFRSRDKKKHPLRFNFKYTNKEKGDLLRDFILNITNQSSKQIIPISELMNVMLVCFAIDKSIKLNKTVDIHYDKFKI